MLGLWPIAADAQIRIGGNVYGGGNHAEVKGSTKVTLKAGDIGAVLDPDATRPLADPQGRVFGGARMANVGGNTFVHIDGESDLDPGTPNYLLVNQVFGGNDIAGTIGTAKAVGEDIPAELKSVKSSMPDPLPEGKTEDYYNDVDDEFNSYVRLSTKVMTGEGSTYTEAEINRDANEPEGEAYGKRVGDVKPAADARKVYIGQLFAGGNGDFDYEQVPGPTEGKVTHYIYNWSDESHNYPIAQMVTDKDEVGFQLPELNKTYLEVEGGSIVYAYGGGNNATVKEKNIIHINNPSAVVNHIFVDKDGVEDLEATAETASIKDLLSTVRFKEMGINTGFSKPSSGAYQVGRFFGGNNKAEMHIRPTWNLLYGKVRNLYSGGNKGNMTSPDGLLLEIPTYSGLIVDNLYGGCRMADVMPTNDKGIYTSCLNLPGYKFPNELSARILVRGGHINNVYGGNDVTGSVYGGNAIGIYTTVYGNVYGGGNGDYPYTDNEKLKNHNIFGDYHYDVPSGMTTSEALNAFRPNAEQVSIRLKGTAPESEGERPNYTVIQGSVYLGGNCATLVTKKKNPLVELKMGSYVIADNVYLGNNGEGMIDEGYLKYYAGEVNDDGDYVESGGLDFSEIDLTDASVFSRYMEGVAMALKPSVVFDKVAEGDPDDYEEYSSYIGSLYCGGNVGSMAIEGKEVLTINKGLNIYNKFVGGCNKADVAKGTYNAAYYGGVIGAANERGESADEYYTDNNSINGKIKDRIEINFENMTITPLRWNDVFTKITSGTLTEDKVYYTTDDRSSKFVAKGTEVASDENVYYELPVPSNALVWNTQKWIDDGFVKVASNADDSDIRLLGGNVYGGCYESGHVNGNIVININQDMLKRNEVFGSDAPAGKRAASGVEVEDQRDDLMAVALSVFGAGYGEDTEVWGSTTVNHNNGYTFQIFGGGQEGAVGKHTDTGGKKEYEFNEAYSTTVNLKGGVHVYSDKENVANLAETEYIYGGGNEGLVAGNTLVNLGNGRIYDAFGGSSDADILGHAEVYIGRQPDGSGGYKDGFPWVRDIIYGGNDFGGTIYGEYEDGYNFEARLQNYETDKTQIHGYKAGEIPEVMKSSTYVEYLQGRVDSIFGGGYGAYDYTNETLYGKDASMPEQHSSFVNVRPKDHAQNVIKAVFGGGTGYPGNRDDDKAQDRSYVLIDIVDGKDKFANLEAFGAGSYNGLGMRYHLNTETGETLDEEDKPISSLDEATAIIDLLHGRIHNAYGGSYQEGVTRRTVVNVPAESTIQIDSIFGGAYGKYILPPCDVYESQVNYKNTSENAQVFGAIFGGNNNERRSLFTQVNISSPVYSNKEKGYTGTVYGAGRGIDTWSEHTEVNLLSGAKVYEVYGGGEMGHVLNSASIQKYMLSYYSQPSQQISEQDPVWSQDKYWNIVGGKKVSLKDARFNPDDETDTRMIVDAWHDDWKNTWTLGSYYVPGKSNGETGATPFEKYATNSATNLDRVSERAELDDNTAALLDGKKYNTNVIINKGAVVEGYAYGGGLGDASVARTGDIYGNTYVTLLGGEVKKDIYGAGRAGGVDNIFEASGSVGFVASANAYVQGGTARNVYGGGYEGHVGHHDGDITTAFTDDRPAKANVVIGKTGTDTYEGGAPAITRNVYGGGEGGSVYGKSTVTFNNGYVGYRYKDSKYEEELDDQKPNDIEMAGNVFGGGYVVNSYVDSTEVNMYGGHVRGSLYGGGEVGPIGRGAHKTGLGKGGLENGDATIFKAGITNVNMYDGYVLRNVFGGGRGKDSWGGDGTKFMKEEVVSSLKSDGLFCKGYVFGQTRVNIHGGEIGTEEGMAYGYGNVFGGGDEGTVYSAYMKDKKLYIGSKIGKRYDGNHEGYYFQYGPSDAAAYIVEGGKNVFTEDCKVVVAPHAQATSDISITGGTGSPRGNGSYKSGEYVTTEDLNLLKNKTAGAAYWDNLDADGIIIHNAVFAGGNLAEGSSSLFANATTVYGNATASIHDVYNRDLITIGTGHTGGLYGDGNLTFVDGYRELNITNYGTDYYHITKQLDYDVYKDLPEREKAYYELKYKCLQSCTDIERTTYSVGSNVPFDELLALFTKPDGTSVLSEGGDSIIVTDTKSRKKVPNPSYWEENGVVSVYAGRIMNTIQRADFCGVFGSRMVMKGAQDRVPEVADYTNYTINRVREVSLNKKNSLAGDTGDNALHGNYFGIYSNVNYLGALTSDVKFSETRTTNADLDKNPQLKPDPDTPESFYEWKKEHRNDKTRNNGTCHNHLALASGVYLELTSEKSTGKDLYEKDWGPITGVIELDLINVQTGIGGGFVYARNEHGKPNDDGIPNATLTNLNDGAASKWNYTYDEKYNNWEEDEEDKEEWQTSGNFIHSSQTIIDDCYNVGGKYKGKYGNKDHGGTTAGVPAHYWYVAGSVYVYDQYISAYTGSPNAYSEKVEIPITVNAASNGTMTLMNVQPNLYAYYSSYVDDSNNTPLSGEQKLVINDVTYQLNDPINYWEWNKLPASEKKLFVSDTYVTSAGCKIGNGDSIYAGTVMLPETYKAYETAAKTKTVVSNGKEVAFSEIFHSSNNMSHTTGYLLTYNVTNPSVWDKWYTQVNSSDRVKNQTGGAGYEDGPTYHPTANGLYGQQDYDLNAIIPEKTYTDYQTLKTSHSSDIPANQAEFKSAYLITKEYTSATAHYYPGAPVSEEISGFTDAAYVSTATIQLSPTEYIYVGDLMTASQKSGYITAHPDLEEEINKCIKPAYICTTAGKYGGSYYETSKNYRGLEAYSAMSPEDRKKFEFNYDALDLLIDPAYGKMSDGTQQAQGKKYQYDGLPYNFDVSTASEETKSNMIYSLAKPIDYTATYKGGTAMTYTDANNVEHSVAVDEELLSTAYEALPNEQHHYAPITVDKAGTYYVVKESFVHGETPYAVGATIDSDTYDRLSDFETEHYITALTFEAEDVKKDGSDKPIPYYYCRESYKVNENGEGVTVSKYKNSIGAGNASYTAGQEVPVGYVIAATNYNDLPNKQKNFTIHGVSPMETSTLFVSRNSDINDLSTEKIITVVYKYDYEESDADGTHITPVSERHVVNIHITFKSGVPTIEDINPPTIVLPGTGITMRIPSVTPGAYEITGGGWEIFPEKSDAESHINGFEYTPSVDPLYWYQDGYYLAYYAKTYLGKTYSNYVPVSVANYHDLKKVMDDKTYHLHVDYDRTRLKRDSKIYINDYSSSSQNGLQLFKDLYDLSLLTTKPSGGRLDGHALLNNSTETGVNKFDGSTNVKGVKGGTNLDFILRTDISLPSGSPAWTSIATGSDPCFNGTLHGDGHTLSGLDNSLFDKLCGNVYNLGVTGSFTGAGIAEHGGGYVESCWINTTGTPDGSVRAVFGDPDAESGYKQLVNSYCQTDKDYKTTDTGAHGLATAKSDEAFYNGEVAYDLNNFYLYKRYNDGVNTAAGADYKYWKSGEEEPQTGYYIERQDLCSSGYKYKEESGTKYYIRYVEDRFADGDFIFAEGEIPTIENERLWIDTENEDKPYYFPIWPDDYIFFGQKLTYGWAAQAHQNVPTAVARDEGRLSLNDDANRVYRASAYFRNSEMSVAHFNPHAYLAQTQKGVPATKAYPNMTAIDFAGHNGANGSYELGQTAAHDGVPALFYPPLLDDDGLIGIENCDETQNLLVYAPAASGESGYVNAKTHGVLESYFTEPAYSDHYDQKDNYRRVTEASAGSVHGHLVQSDLTATNDHLLVDLQDFNAPISYKFDDSHLMWYQRMPNDNEFVDLMMGWQGISIPFTAELVTTDTKGEITHFFNDGGENAKGHEYWLRQLGSTMTEISSGVLKAEFGYPSAGDFRKEYTNSFLWDYYYKNEPVHNQKDKNDDTYLRYKQYYKDPHTYKNYPLLQAATPYILGLPGRTYYEFDLSGKFDAENTAKNIEKLDKQLITFASNTGAIIGKSDGEMDGKTVRYNSTDYTFKPSYLNMELEAGKNYYILKPEFDSDGNGVADCSVFDKVPALGDATLVGAFRPYFTIPGAGSSPARGMQRFLAKRIVFGDADGGFGEGPETVLDGSLEIFTRGYNIVTISHMEEPTAIRIVNAAGATITNYVLQPGEAIETPVAVTGVYVVNKKKVFVE